VERWGADDFKRSPFHMAGVVAYLIGKAADPHVTAEKRAHHQITAAAVCLNWHRYGQESAK
jgi:hypothetical protein